MRLVHGVGRADDGDTHRGRRWAAEAGDAVLCRGLDAGVVVVEGLDKWVVAISLAEEFAFVCCRACAGEQGKRGLRKR